jgi:hypothetical protein
MRKITDHRLEGGDFNDALQGVIRNSPWWMLSRSRSPSCGVFR